MTNFRDNCLALKFNVNYVSEITRDPVCFNNPRKYVAYCDVMIYINEHPIRLIRLLKERHAATENGVEKANVSTWFRLKVTKQNRKRHFRWCPPSMVTGRIVRLFL